jgi:hypothetical protein
VEDNTDRKEQKEMNKTAVKIIIKIKKLENEFGGVAVRYAMRKYLTQFAEENKRHVQIAKLERELVALKKKELK